MKQNCINVTEMFSKAKMKMKNLISFCNFYWILLKLCLKKETAIHSSPEKPKKVLTVENSTLSSSVSHNTGKNIDI